MHSDKYQESPVVNREGWVRIVDGGTTRYRSPGEQVISNRQYYNLSKTYPAPNPIPESAISAPAGVTKASDALNAIKSNQPFISGSTAPKMETSIDPGAQRLAQYQAQTQQQEPEEEPVTFRDNIREIGSLTGIDSKKKPKGTKTDRRFKEPHPRATAAGLGEGIRKLLLLITTLVIAKILNDERAIMSNQEAMILGHALGNLLEPTQFNEQYGWLIAETGDWQAIGYVLIMYGSRINDIVQDKKRAAAGGQQHTSNIPPPTASSSNGYQSTPQYNAPRTPGANLPFSPLKAPPGINPNYGG